MPDDRRGIRTRNARARVLRRAAAIVRAALSCSNYDGKCPFAKVQYLQPFTRMLQSGANVIEEATKRRPLRSKALRFSKGFPINEIPLSASP